MVSIDEFDEFDLILSCCLPATTARNIDWILSIMFMKPIPGNLTRKLYSSSAKDLDMNMTFEKSRMVSNSVILANAETIFLVRSSDPNMSVIFIVFIFLGNEVV